MPRIESDHVPIWSGHRVQEKKKNVLGGVFPACFPSAPRKNLMTTDALLTKSASHTKSRH